MTTFCNRRITLRAALLGAAATFAFAGAASAQETAAIGDGAAEQGEGAHNSGVIVVTAQKREQDVQDVPISMAVVSGDELTDRGITDFKELDRYVPNLFVQETPGNNAYYIRGIGSTPGNLAFEQTVGLFVDGIYGGHARQFQAPFLDVERVEVLRGPQGALVGKNTSAGAISIVSAKPTDYFTAQLDASYEFEYGGTRIFGMASGPVSDVVSVRLAAQYEDTDGYIENLTLGGSETKRQTFFARGSLLIDSGGPVDLLIKVEGGNVDLTGSTVERLLTDNDPDLERSTSGFPGFVDKDFDNTDTVNMAATANFEIGDHTLTSITGYSSYNYEKRLDSDFGPAPLFASLFAEDFSQLSQEVRLASPAGGRVEYIFGGYAHINDYDLTGSTQLLFGPFDGSTTRYFSQENTALSAFASATFYATDTLRLLGSVRYTYDKKTADQRRENQGVVLPSYLTTPLNGRIVEKEWDPSVAIQYDVLPDVMVYASYGQGSKAGGFVGAQATTTEDTFVLGSESAETWEAGVKLAAFDRRLRLNLAGYRTDFDNLQVSSFDSATTSFITSNAGKARSQGFEGDMSFEVTPGISINGSMAYLDAKFRDFPGAPCFFDDPGCDPALNNAAGRVLPRASKWSGTLGFSIDQPVTDGIDFVAGGTMTFRSKYFTEESYNPDAAQESYQKYDLRVGLRSADERWEVAVVGKNITDELTASHGFGTPITGGFSQFIQTPRTIAAQVRLKI